MKPAWSRLLLTAIAVGVASCSIEDTAETMVAADEIFDIGPVLTMVGGRVVYEADE